MSDQNTREKILTIARVLFADHGFDGTSIRDIAKEADVNVASVNYHFASKENLYMEIITQGYKECSVEMRTFIDTHKPSVEEILIHLFRYFNGQSHDLISSFKMLMSAKHGSQGISRGTEDEEMGPPGGKAISEVIRKEAGTDIDEDIHYALKVLFGHVVHQAIIYNCNYKHEGWKVPFCTLDDLEKDIRRLSKSVLRDIKKT